MNPNYYLILSAILFAFGVLGFLLRRNAILSLMSVELMLNAAEVTVGLAIIVTIYRSRRSTSVDDVNLLKY